MDGRVHILKLHGSVNWIETPQANGTKEVREVDNMDEVFSLGGVGPDEVSIASPGNSKRDVAEKDYGVLWETALERIRFADVIVFLGYRFPPSDSEAMTRFLNAIASNTNDFLSCVTVLGQNTQAAESVRLKRLLEACVLRGATPRGDDPMPKDDDSAQPSTKRWRYGEVRSEPLFAEDYLSLWALGPLQTAHGLVGPGA